MAKAKKKPDQAKSIQNRRARHDYALGDDLIVGIQLTGGEAKSLRRGHGHIRGAYVNVKNGELWLINSTITGDNAIKIAEADQTRNRKLLASRKEIEALERAKQQGQTIVPLEVLTRGQFVKLRIAVGRGKKNYDKRQALKARDDKRASDSAIKSRLR